MESCPSCKVAGKMRLDTAALERELGGVTFKAKVPALRCGVCKEWFVSFEEGRRFELAVALAVAEHGISSADAFKFMRKATELRASDLAELLAVTPETVSRWETGKVPVERRALALLQALVTDRVHGTTVTLDRLKALCAVKRRKPRAVRVAL